MQQLMLSRWSCAKLVTAACQRHFAKSAPALSTACAHMPLLHRPSRARLTSATVMATNVLRASGQQPLLASRAYSTAAARGMYGLDKLWEGVTGYNPPGKKKRARGKRRVTRPKVDMFKGVFMGTGPEGHRWPGLSAMLNKSRSQNAPSFANAELTDSFNKKVLSQRNVTARGRSRRKLLPLERGWTGGSMMGQLAGPPEPSLDYDFTEFNTVLLEVKAVATMTAAMGRKRRFSVLLALGNGRGALGTGVGKSTSIFAAIRKAKRKAANRLEFFEFYEGRTLWHNSFIRMHASKLIAFPRADGTGLVCHRLIKSLCQIVGINDLYAKVEGSTTNYQKITQAFVSTLRSQETFQQLSDREQLHVVQQSSLSDNYPKLLASPSVGNTRQVGPTEDLDLERLYFDGQVYDNKPQPLPGYLRLPGVLKKSAERFRFRNRDLAERERQVYEGLAEHFPKSSNVLE